MKSIGIICEFNPLHNGHVYFIDTVKKMYPEHVLVLVLNGYFLERGEVSVLSKEDKTYLALKYGVDIVLELPVIFGTQSADTFAEKSIEILNNFNVEKIVFGSECNDVNKLESLASIQLNDKEYNKNVLSLLKTGINYPSALAKALKSDEFSFTPNDLLGLSYIKAILKNEFNIKYDTIKRTNSFHDNLIDEKIVSASNIREKLDANKNVLKYLPSDSFKKLKTVDKVKYFGMLKFKILTDIDLSIYLDVDEGIENRLIEKVKVASSLDELIKLVKNKRFTYNKINRMLVHVLLGVKKTDAKITLEYTKILGFSEIGREYIKSIKKEINLPSLVNKDSLVFAYEEKASYIYEMLTNNSVQNFEKSNKPIKF